MKSLPTLDEVAQSSWAREPSSHSKVVRGKVGNYPHHLCDRRYLSNVSTHKFNKAAMSFKFLLHLSVIVLLILEPLAAAEQAVRFQRLIAHRGGVVNEQHREHSFEGLKAAIDRGYWMVEVDVRETKDGLPIVHHDHDFQRYYHHPGKVNEMTWDEIEQLRSDPGDRPPILLSDFAARCQGRIRLMLEIKGPAHDQAFYSSIERILSQNKLLNETYMLGIPEAKQFFRGKLRTSIQREGLRESYAAGEDVARLYFLFEGAHLLDEQTVAFACKSCVPVVAAINKHHYQGEEPKQHAYNDLTRMKGLGITTLQIDSIYDRWLLR